MGDSERTPLLGSPPQPRRSARDSQAEEQVGPGRMIRLNRVHLCLALFILAVISTVTAVLLCAHQLKETTPSNTTVSPTTTRQPRSTVVTGTTSTLKTYTTNKSIIKTLTTAKSEEKKKKLEGATTSLRLLSLMVWGSPGSFGTADKELRIAAIGNLTQSPDWDIFVLSDLWMRPDHDKIQQSIPEGWDMTSVGDLSLPSCDGVIAPEFCSGLAVVSRFPILEVDFTAFAVSGDLLWDYEYFLRRGLGRVRVEPIKGEKVDIYVTSLASMDYNYWYREHQAAQLVTLLAKSDSDYLVLAGDFNVDPRDGEATYKTFKGALTDSVEEYYKDDKSKWLDPNLSTLGNPANSYTSKGAHPVIYDYVWYRPAKDKAISVSSYQVPHLTTGGKKDVSLSSHEGVSVTLNLA